MIQKPGLAVEGFTEGQRVIAGAICTSGHNAAALCGCHAQDGPKTKHGFKPLGGWRFGNTIDGTQTEYVFVPDGLTDEQVLMCPDIMSTGFSGAESGNICMGDTVAVFAQGPIGLCATAGARLMGASMIIAVERVPARMEMARRMGADHIVDFSKVDPVTEILSVTDGRGVDVAIEALSTKRLSRARSGCCAPAVPCPRLAFISTISQSPSMPFSPAWETTR